MAQITIPKTTAPKITVRRITAARIATVCVSAALLLGILLLGCTGASAAPEVANNAANNNAGDTTVDNTRGSGSIGGWRTNPGQRTIFDRGFRIPTTITFRADGGNWSGNISIVDRTTNRSLCQRTISAGQQTSCSGIQGNFRLTVANNANSRDTATGDIRFNN